MLADARITFRPYTPGDEPAILDLFERSFFVKRTPEHFAWKYRGNPYGNERISLAWDSDRLVAQYAAYPVRVWLDGQNLIANHIGDIMSDPSVRHVGRGPTSVFARTAADFYTRFCEGRVAFNYGFNTATSRAFSVRFTRAEAVEPVTYRSRVQVARLSRLRRWIRGYRLELVRDVNAEYDDFFERVAPSYRFLVRRDATYLRWRYFTFVEPGYFFVAIRKGSQLVGWSAFRVRGDKLVWGDALFDPAFEDAADVLLRHVAPAYPVSTIECWFPPRPSWFDSILNRLGFVAAREPNDLSLSCVPFTLGDAPQRIRESLYYAMGDADLF